LIRGLQVTKVTGFTLQWVISSNAFYRTDTNSAPESDFVFGPNNHPAKINLVVASNLVCASRHDSLAKLVIYYQLVTALSLAN